MGSANPTADPANVIQSLVYTLLDVFDATRDLYQTLRAKEKRDYEQSRRSRGYPRSRSVEYVDDEDLDNEDAIAMDKAAVTRQLDIGLQEIGPQFAIGDVLSQTGLQSQIITLQSAIITTFLYGPTSPDPISIQLSSIIDASRSAGTASVDILAAQHHRQLANLTPTPISVRSPVPRAGPTRAPPYPATAATGISSASTALIKSRHEPTSRRGSPMNTTVLEWQGKPKFDRSDTDTTSLTGPTSYGTQSAPHSLYCLYALDLQRHPQQPLSGSITHDSSPFCPYCKRALHLSPGKSWEIFKDDEGVERCFRIQNRFVVKCHRDTADGGYSCVLCSRSASVDTVCGDVKALIRHIWMDHDAGELELEEDVIKVSQEELDDQRRDSGMGLGGRRSSRSSRRSVSLGPSRSQRRPPRFEREVETLEIRPPRHQG